MEIKNKHHVVTMSFSDQVRVGARDDALNKVTIEGYRIVSVLHIRSIIEYTLQYEESAPTPVLTEPESPKSLYGPVGSENNPYDTTSTRKSTPARASAQTTPSKSSKSKSGTTK